MTTWQQTENYPEYKETAEAVETLHPPAVGFLNPDAYGQTLPTLRALIKQNNFLIQAVIQQSAELQKIKEQIAHIDAGVRSLRAQKEKATPESLVQTIEGLSKKLEGVNLKETSKTVPEPVRSVAYFRDPKKILDEAKKRQR